MPVLTSSSYRGPKPYLFNGHLETIYPAVFRTVGGISYTRERFTLSDGDFVDLDWVREGNNQLVILIHGLEGDSSRHYIKGTGKVFQKAQFDLLAFNCRSCSGEINNALRLYNHGEIGDLGEVIDHINQVHDYQTIVIVGWSMGGNITMKYLGVNGTQTPKNVKAGIALSAPAQLGDSAGLLDNWDMSLYRNRFLTKLKEKITIKAEHYPDQIDLSYFDQIKVWKDFDEYYSAPINGYQNADDLYEQGSAGNFMAGTDRPILLVNALNDPLLTPSCSPEALCNQHPLLYLEMPKTGGHCSFTRPFEEHLWAEHRALEFVQELVG